MVLSPVSRMCESFGVCGFCFLIEIGLEGLVGNPSGWKGAKPRTHCIAHMTQFIK